ncbi:hypothetical protein K1W54_01045, partial [Micromonospora sp. CPCC 205371]|nr:hypothetical protein [Micromonospora sp. CPCC 205371]
AGLAVGPEPMPPLMWHAEVGKALPALWSASHHRGVQLHDLRSAVLVWARRYGQRAWLRQLEPPPGVEQENAVLRTIARLDGTPFPSTTQLAWRWLRGRAPVGTRPRKASSAALESTYCAEVVGITYEAMGLLPEGRDSNWYDPGRFWSGDDLGLTGGYRLGTEIAVEIPPA